MNSVVRTRTLSATARVGSNFFFRSTIHGTVDLLIVHSGSAIVSASTPRQVEMGLAGIISVLEVLHVYAVVIM